MTLSFVWLTWNLSVLTDSSLSFVAPVRSESKHFHSMVEIDSESYQFSTTYTTISLSQAAVIFPTWIAAAVSPVLLWFCLCAHILVEELVICVPSLLKTPWTVGPCLSLPLLKILPESHSHSFKAEVFLKSKKALVISLALRHAFFLSPQFYFTSVTPAFLLSLSTLSINLP